jgi:hypothetical protein
LAYIKRGGKKKKIYADRLVQEGFFAHCRNPLYVGNILIMAGLIMVHHSVWMYALALPFFLFSYFAIVMAEERFLRGKFGPEYDRYCRRVPRFIPRLRGLGRTMRGMKFDWKKVVRMDYGTAFTWASCAIGLLMWKGIANFGYAAEREEIRAMIGVWVLVLIGYIVARVLKKTGTLDSDEALRPAAMPSA